MGETTLFSVPLTTVAVRAPGDSPEFMSFWLAYPRRVGKGAARTAFSKALKKAPAERIMLGLLQASWPSDPQYIPHPATWLNQERWDDEPPEQIDHVARILGI
jgi:hypothetical protein